MWVSRIDVRTGFMVRQEEHQEAVKRAMRGVRAEVVKERRVERSEGERTL